MAFRIDGVGMASNRWYCLLKGVRGESGAFGLLMTGARGKGLQLAEEVIPEPARFLLGPEVFCLPLHLTHEEAEKRFAEAMLQLGWGPDISHE